MGLFEVPYYLGYRLHSALQSRKRRALPLPVVSIGNLTTGGTGKTPAAIALAEEARRRGRVPCILTRGFKGRWKGTVMVHPSMRAIDVGDEPLLMARALEPVAVVKDPDRYRGGMHALASLHPRPDMFILDDGYQHRRLARDADILLLSAREVLYESRLLPMGRLREPWGAIDRADLLLVTKAEGFDMREVERRLRRYNPEAPIHEARHVPERLVGALTMERHPIGAVKGRSVFAFCGIADPASFMRTVEGLGARVAGQRAFGDHHRFGARDMKRIERLAQRSGADWIITTEKDIMRLQGEFDRLPGNLLFLTVRLDVAESFHDSVFQLIA